MSESKRLSGEHSFLEIEATLQGLLPEGLTIDRDQLFYRAGYVAAKASLTSDVGDSPRSFLRVKIWPAAAAALLLVSVGLGLSFYRQSVDIKSLRTALAVQEEEMLAASRGRVSPRREEAANDLAESVHESSAALARVSERRDHGDENILYNRRARELQRLASTEPLPPGRLTALGWRELSPEELATWSSEDSPAMEKTKQPRSQRANTYWELLRQLES